MQRGDEERDWKLLELLNWAIKFSRLECLSFCEIVTNFRDFSLFSEAKSSLRDYIDHLQKVSLLMKSRNFSSRRAEKADKSESDQASLQCAPPFDVRENSLYSLSRKIGERIFHIFSLENFRRHNIAVVEIWKCSRSVSMRTPLQSEVIQSCCPSWDSLIIRQIEFCGKNKKTIFKVSRSMLKQFFV